MAQAVHSDMTAEAPFRSFVSIFLIASWHQAERPVIWYTVMQSTGDRPPTPRGEAAAKMTQ